jgi:hypothetical protein
MFSRILEPSGYFSWFKILNLDFSRIKINQENKYSKKILNLSGRPTFSTLEPNWAKGVICGSDFPSG